MDELVSQHVVVETFEKGTSVAEYLHVVGNAPKVTSWVRSSCGKKWEAVDPKERLEAMNVNDDERALREKVALCGIQAYLKMVRVANNPTRALLAPMASYEL